MAHLHDVGGIDGLPPDARVPADDQGTLCGGAVDGGLGIDGIVRLPFAAPGRLAVQVVEVPAW